jgi:Rv0078B-related antitoxin
MGTSTASHLTPGQKELPLCTVFGYVLSCLRCAEIENANAARYGKRYSNTVEFSDTSPKAQEIYFQRLKEMTPSERLGLGAALWQAGDSVQRAAIRRQYPHADEAEIAFRIAVTRFGLELARKAYRRA